MCRFGRGVGRFLGVGFRGEEGREVAGSEVAGREAGREAGRGVGRLEWRWASAMVRSEDMAMRSRARCCISSFLKTVDMYNKEPAKPPVSPRCVREASTSSFLVHLGSRKFSRAKQSTTILLPPTLLDKAALGACMAWETNQSPVLAFRHPNCETSGFEQLYCMDW